MKILHVIASLAPRYGGPSVACPALCRELARRGHQVSIFTTNVDGNGLLDVPLDCPVIDQGVEIRFFPGYTHPLEYKPSPALWRALREKIPSVDLVHIYSMYIFSATATAHLCRKLRVPYLLHPHGCLDPYLLRRHVVRKWFYSLLFERRNFNHAAAILFNSPEEMRLAAPWLDRVLLSNSGHRAPRRDVVYVGVEQAYLTRQPSHARERFRRKFPELAGRRIVLFFGRLSFKKGMDILAQAFIQVAQKLQNVHLVLAGPDTEGYGARVRDWLKAAGVLEMATFTGPLAGDDRFIALQEAEVFVLPSYSENFGQSVAEAMASGVPVVISNRVNIWPAVEEVGAGLVVPCDPRQTAQALLALLENPDLGKRMGSRGRQLVEERLNSDLVTEQMLRLYAGIANREAVGSHRVEERAIS